jgi:glycosyltransferase involved in cell wall biosynthesis
MLIQNVLVIPSYKEYAALPVFLAAIFDLIDDRTQVIVVDDSPEETWDGIVQTCQSAAGKNYNRLAFSFSKLRNGRGGAVRRGFEKALQEYPSAVQFIECDADGSHRPYDVLKLINSERRTNVLIGSRYLEESKIIGWPLSRRIFSALLNFLIPRIMHLRISDITNGLRIYDLQSVEALLAQEQQNTSFIYLTEQIFCLERAGLTIGEIPICFINRTIGESTVGIHEIKESLIGLGGIFYSQFRARKFL